MNNDNTEKYTCIGRTYACGITIYLVLIGDNLEKQKGNPL